MNELRLLLAIYDPRHSGDVHSAETAELAHGKRMLLEQILNQLSDIAFL
jgi:hypothetical protein